MLIQGVIIWPGEALKLSTGSGTRPAETMECTVVASGGYKILKTTLIRIEISIPIFAIQEYVYIVHVALCAQMHSVRQPLVSLPCGFPHKIRSVLFFFQMTEASSAHMLHIGWISLGSGRQRLSKLSN